MTDNYILFANGRVQNTASSKAKTDVNDILESEDYQPIYFNTHITRIKKLLFARILANKVISKVQNNYFIIQYPMYSHYMTKLLLHKASKSNKALTIGLLHDVASLRNSTVDHETLEDEISFFNSFAVLIAHNNKMKRWLEQNGTTTPIVSLDIFDYLNPQPILHPKFSGTLIFAGNLEKADFLQQVNSKLSINLYGPNKANDYPDNVVYKGIYSAEELPAHLEGSFGLVWDGNSVDECNGPYGEYLKYNNPHKTSLYLSSGLPVIIWKKAAMADFILKNNLGLAVDSLNDVDEEIAKLTSDKYQQMLSNVAIIANKLRNGYFTKHAIELAKMNL